MPARLEVAARSPVFAGSGITLPPHRLARPRSGPIPVDFGTKRHPRGVPGITFVRNTRIALGIRYGRLHDPGQVDGCLRQVGVK